VPTVYTLLARPRIAAPEGAIAAPAPAGE
jgi:hypothetical protein